MELPAHSIGNWHKVAVQVILEEVGLSSDVPCWHGYEGGWCQGVGIATR